MSALLPFNHALDLSVNGNMAKLVPKCGFCESQTPGHTRVSPAWMDRCVLLGMLFGCVSVLYAILGSAKRPFTDP